MGICDWLYTQRYRYLGMCVEFWVVTWSMRAFDFIMCTVLEFVEAYIVLH